MAEKEKERCCHLPPDTAGGLFPTGLGWKCWFVSVTGKPEVRGLKEAAGAHIRIRLDPIGMLWALKGQRGRTGASVSANLVGR